MCSSDLKLSKDEPWYLPTTSKDTQKYAIDLKENARELRNTIAQLGGLEGEGLFSKKNAYSTNEEVATASYIGPKNPSGHIPELTRRFCHWRPLRRIWDCFFPEAARPLWHRTPIPSISISTT